MSSVPVEMSEDDRNKVTVRQDMTEEGFFEGTEKLLEVWFSSSSADECEGDAGPEGEASGSGDTEGKNIVSDLRMIDR